MNDRLLFGGEPPPHGDKRTPTPGGMWAMWICCAVLLLLLLILFWS